MKNYERPIVIENDEIFEGVYAASGEGSYDLTMTNVDNNSGSLSVVEMNFQLNLSQGGEKMEINLHYNGAGNIEEISGVSGMEFSYDEKNIHIVRNNHFNAGDNITFNINGMKFSERADGTTDDQSNGHHGSMFQTDSGYHDVGGLFDIEVKFS